MALDLAKMRNLSPDELSKEEDALRDEIWKLRLQVTTGQLQDSNKVRAKRRDLARMLTVRQEQLLKPGADGKKRSEKGDKS